MTTSIKHAKTNNITAWTQADLNAQIAAGNIPAGTTLADIPLSTDWNSDHTITGLLTAMRVDLVNNGSNVNIASAPSSFDGITASSGWLILLTNQTTQSQNGLYTFNGAGSAMTRVSTYNSDNDIRGSMLWAQRGTSNVGKLFQNTNTSAITVGTTAITYADQLQAGTGMVKSGRLMSLAYGIQTITPQSGGSFNITNPNFNVSFLCGDGTLSVVGDGFSGVYYNVNAPVMAATISPYLPSSEWTRSKTLALTQGLYA